jgi:K+-sensing histidine kinase KdpD
VAAVGISFIAAGTAPGVYSLVLATLASDFFFVDPQFRFTMNSEVLGLFSYYAVGGAFSYVMTRHLRPRR